jgi:flagellar hook assembly protein FlgD
MAVGSVNSYGLPIELTTAASAQGPETKSGNFEKVGKDEFLQLLVAQLKNQDPLDPVKNEDFLAQLASFSSLEQLVSIKEGINKLAGITTDGTDSSTETITQS